MPEKNLKAYENLKETTAGSLNSKEKADLNKLEKSDFNEEIKKRGEETFTIDWKKMKVKDILKKIDTEWGAPRLNWKPIDKRSKMRSSVVTYGIAIWKADKLLIIGFN